MVACCALAGRLQMISSAADSAVVRGRMALPGVQRKCSKQQAGRAVGYGRAPAARRLVADGEVIQDSRKPLVFISGRRPLTGGLTPGAVEALSTMQAGGRRRIFVPASQAPPPPPPPSSLSAHLPPPFLAGM